MILYQNNRTIQLIWMITARIDQKTAADKKSATKMPAGTAQTAVPAGQSINRFFFCFCLSRK
jgi:hypothetical protein